jgi:glycerol uptake facilitator-like aquaporin
MTLAMDPVLSLVLIGMLPIIGIVVYFVTKTSVPLYTKQQGVLDRVVRTVQENITGIRVIKALSKTEYEKNRFRDVNDELTAVDMKAGFITTVTNPVASLTLNLGLTLVVVHILGIGLTGTSVNPARSIGPALFAAFSGNFAPLGCLWVFIVGPLLGAALAAFTYNFLQSK